MGDIKDSVPPDHMFFFSLRDSLNFGEAEHFGVMEDCLGSLCKLRNESFKGSYHPWWPVERVNKYVSAIQLWGASALGVTVLCGLIASCIRAKAPKEFRTRKWFGDSHRDLS